MYKRIEYASTLVDSGVKARHIILLSGERYASIGPDGDKDQLQKVVDKFHLSSIAQVTETHLIRDAYDKSTLRLKEIPVDVIDTARGYLPRPTTQTTILELIKWLNNHTDIKKVIFVSNQPHILYQKAMIDAIFKEQKSALEYEIVGDKAAHDASLHILTEGLGAYIWALTPSILSAMDIQNPDEDITQAVDELYRKNPLLYNSIPQIFKK